MKAEKRNYMKVKRISYMWFAPFVTLAVMLVLYAIAGIYPFGESTTAVGDGLAQYLPFLSELTYKIKEGGSLLFSWHAGRGVNFWANCAYYLASPFNVIALLFKTENMADAFSLISLIKPAFAALTFSIYLKKTYNKNDISIVIFSVFWSLSSFILATTYLATWIDAIIYFPLVIMGLKKLMDGESAWQYSLFLGLTIVSNFYFGYMTCIFCVIYFIYSLISDEDVVYEGINSPQASDGENDESESTVNIFAVFKNSYLIKTGCRFALASLLGGALTAVLSLPTVFALSNTGKGTTENTLFMIEDIWNVLASHVSPFKNNYGTLTANDIIFCFAGLISVILVVAYFFAKGISIRKKIGNLFLLLVMWVSIVFFNVYIIWHAFSLPAGIMQRFAFIYIFVILKIAFEAFINIEKINIIGVIAGALFSAVCIAGIRLSDFIYNELYSAQLVATLAVFLVVYTTVVLIMVKKEKTRKVLSTFIAILAVVEMTVLNTDNISSKNWGKTITDGTVISEMGYSSELGEYTQLQLKNQSFRDNLMYGLLYNYNSNDYYSSLADYNYTLMQNIIGSYGNSLNLENGAMEQTPIANVMFPVKYFIDGNEDLSENQFRKKTKELNGYTLFENQYTMPFMYTVNSGLTNWDPFIYPIPTDLQNSAFKAYTGTEKNAIVYSENKNFTFENCYQSSYLETVKVQAENKNIEWNENSNEYFNMLEKKMASYTVKFKDRNKDAYVHFDAVAQADGIQYIYVDVSAFTDMKITINGKTKSYYTYGIGECRMYELGEVKKGDVIKVSLGGHKEDADGKSDQIYKNAGEIFSAICFTVDMDVFEKGYEKLDAMSDTELLEFSDTHVKAKVTSYEDGLLYIPTTYDEGWTITVDGNEVPLYEHESHILMTEITKGEHIVEMKYCPQGFTAGAVITGASLLILIAWAVISKKRSDKINAFDISQNNVNEE